jgi:hypothetical protein
MTLGLLVIFVIYNYILVTNLYIYLKFFLVVVYEIIMKVLLPIVFGCDLNQSCGHWLFKDAM